MTKKSSRKKRALLNTQRGPPGRGLADLIILLGGDEFVVVVPSALLEDRVMMKRYPYATMCVVCGRGPSCPKNGWAEAGRDLTRRSILPKINIKYTAKKDKYSGS